ncbi:MAG: TPM domain-containing protein [Akkermansiaceae bacterium]|nr:TPM domain-containing protein [Akkermansiaceae bacterium]
MKCPRCVQRIHRAAQSCPHCGFSLADADAHFGEDEVTLRSLTDAAGLLRRGGRRKVEAAMEEIGRRFPQVFVAVYTGPLGEVANIRQFGFWMLNRAAFEDVPVGKPNEAGILFTIDPESKAAGVTFGYLLDPYLEEADTFDCLSRAHSHWLDGRYADGLVKAIRHLGTILAKRSRQARRDPEKFERKVLPPPQMGDLVRRIRSGHRVPEEQPVVEEVEK